MSELLTASRLKAARACQRLHWLKYGLGYRARAQGAALRFGTLFHKGLEAWWIAMREGRNALHAALEAVQGESDPFDRVRAEELLRGYHYRWCDEDYEVLGVEVLFRAPLLNPSTYAKSRVWELAGKIDAIVRDRKTGRIFIVEHKTSSEDISQGSEYWRRLRMDGQVSVYYAGAASVGFPPTGCVYDVIGKPQIRPLKANSKRSKDESPEEFRARLIEAISSEPHRYFQRGQVVRLEAEMAEAMFDVWQTAQGIREAHLAKRYPRNPDSCHKYGRACEFFGVCTGMESLEDPTLFERLEDPHPELREEIANASTSQSTT